MRSKFMSTEISPKLATVSSCALIEAIASADSSASAAMA